MAKHNKWSKVKRLKAVTDSRRGKVFSRISRDLTLAAKSGGGDPDGNARLRTLILKAREANMPADNVDRAIKKGTGELPGVVYEEITYEGYGPGGVAFNVQATTDNKTRAAKDIRAAFARHDGNLASTGAVSFQFLHAGQFLVAKEKIAEDALLEIALAAGADDILTSEQGYEIRCGIHGFDKVAHALEQLGLFERVVVKDTRSQPLGAMPATRFEIEAVADASRVPFVAPPNARPSPATGGAK